MIHSRVLTLATLFTVSAFSLPAGTLTVTVSSTAMPWLWDTTSLNAAFQYGLQDGTGPTTIDSSSGISFAPGGTLMITYLDGLTSAFGGAPEVTAEGYGPNPPSPFVYDASNNLGSSGQLFPSFYMDPAAYPIYLNTLVGTFTDLAGNIVGTPFAVFGGPLSVVVPVGAAQLQLGINDDVFSDNTGALLVQVTGPDAASVPEPASLLLLGSAFALAGMIQYRPQRADSGRNQ
jgi:hypothetical protein